ncbi:unnamed protein product, partial [Staurois parvus]
MGRSQELSEFKRGTVIGCHLFNKSIHEISLLLNIPRSTISGIITKEAIGNNSNSAMKCTQKSPTVGRVKDLQTLLLVKITVRASTYQDILNNFLLPTLWEQFGDS